MRTETIERVLIATGNAGKVREIRGLLRDLPVAFRSLADHPSIVPVDETGCTFAQNAALKAAGYAQTTGDWCLADDSGLEVSALEGRPGVLSARYGGDHMPFPAKMKMLLNELAELGEPERDARFVCVMALADRSGRIRFTAEGECRGRIARSLRGEGGFGFDPIFIPDGFDQTFGELPESVKAGISHRSAAFAKIKPYLLDFIGVPT